MKTQGLTLLARRIRDDRTSHLCDRVARIQYRRFMSQSSVRHLPTPLIALAGWLVPGFGYALIGERKRAIIAGTTILLTFLLGLLIGGIRVIDVPGYGPDGAKKMVTVNKAPMWKLRADVVGEIMYKPWYIAQSMNGPVNLLATWGSIIAGSGEHPVKASTAMIFDIGTLYTAVAGMLNLLVIIDATYRAAHPRRDVGAGA